MHYVVKEEATKENILLLMMAPKTVRHLYLKPWLENYLEI